MTETQKELITFVLDADKYKTMHRILESVTNRCGITFNKEGLSSVTVDPANIGMGSLNIDKDAFVEYSLAEGQKTPLKIGFDLDKLREIGLLEKYNSGNIRFKIFEHNGDDKHNVNKTKIMCTVHHDIFNDTFELPQITLLRMAEKLMSTHTDCIFTIDKQTLAKVSARSLDTDINIICNNNSSVKFTDISQSEWTTDEIPTTASGEAHSMYNLNYLSDFVNAIPDNTPIKFSYKTDFPCKMEIEFAKGCTAAWLIAPRRISDD